MLRKIAADPRIDIIACAIMYCADLVSLVYGRQGPCTEVIRWAATFSARFLSGVRTQCQALRDFRDICGPDVRKELLRCVVVRFRMRHVGWPVVIIIKKGITICPNALRGLNRFVCPERHALASLDGKAGIDVIRRCKEALQECGVKCLARWAVMDVQVLEASSSSDCLAGFTEGPAENGDSLDLVAKWVWTCSVSSRAEITDAKAEVTARSLD